MLKRSHIESTWRAAFLYIATKGILWGASAWRTRSMLEMSALPLEIRSYGALASVVLALPEGIRAWAGVSAVFEHAHGPSGKIVAICAAADPRYVMVLLAILPEAGFCGVALARRQPPYLGVAAVALSSPRRLFFLVEKPILVPNGVTSYMEECDTIGTLSSQGERPMSILSGAEDVHGSLIVTMTAALTVAAGATLVGSMFPYARSVGTPRRRPRGHREYLFWRRSSMLPEQ